MRLKNKKTGEIGEIGYIGSSSGKLTVSPINSVACETIASYNSLAELNEEWEDAPEEPKEYWCITGRGNLHYLQDMTDENNKDHREIGNYFDTKEEAEKAVEKLKAWKRLKDKGIMLHLQKQFRSDGVGYSRTIYTDFSKDSEEIIKDLDICFGGEE